MNEFSVHHALNDLVDTLGLSEIVQPEKCFHTLVMSPSHTASVPNAREAAITLASTSPDSEAVLSKYQELQHKNYLELDPLIGLLNKIKESRPALRLLRAGINSSRKKPDHSVVTSVDAGTTLGIIGDVKLKELKNKLQSECENQSTLSRSVDSFTPKARCILSNPTQRNPGWIVQRTYLSWDFPLPSPKFPTPHFFPPQQPSDLHDVPPNNQEQILVEELLDVLSGFTSDHIQTTIPSSELEERKFKVNESMDESLKEMLKRFIPIFSHYSSIQRFYESRSGFDYGMVNDALAEAMGKMVNDYHIFICQLESQLLKYELNLQKLWYLLQPNILVLHQLHHITHSLMKSKVHGPQVLSFLHQHTLECMGNQKQQNLLLKLTRAACRPYWNILCKWIYYGTVEDPYNEFMVEDHQMVAMDRSSPSSYSDDYWEKRYILCLEKVPSFLVPLADKILRTGKYLNVIKQCGLKVNPPKLLPELTYTLDGSGYCETIEKAYSYASETLLRILMQEYDLLGRLRSVKLYFFLNAGDFILHFLSLCGKELCKNVDDVMPSRLESLLELSLRTSSTNVDPFKDDLGLDLFSYGLTAQMVRILSIQTQDERAEAEPSSESAHLSGLEAFSFVYRVRWPVSLVFTTKVMACYQIIFRHLFFTKYVEKLLSKAWMSHKLVRSYEPWSTNAFALRHRMLHFVQNLLYYITFEVLEPSWQTFVEKIKKVDNVDQVISTHMELLSVCMKESMLTDPLLLKVTTKLIRLCQVFACLLMKVQGDGDEQVDVDNFINSTYLSEVFAAYGRDQLELNIDSFGEMIKHIDLHFTTLLGSLLQRIGEIGHECYDSHLLTLLNRLDFNNFYSLNSFQLPSGSFNHTTDNAYSG